MRQLALIGLLTIAALSSLLIGVGCDDLTTEVNNNTFYDSTLGEDCLRCHADDDNAIRQPLGQWRTSAHASAKWIEAEVTVNGLKYWTNKCGPQCHTAEGFIQFTKAGTISEQPKPTTLECYACHMPHTGPYGSWQLDTLRGLKSPAVLNGNIDYNMGNSNMCVTCHQAPKIPTIPAATRVPLDSLGNDGPHYSSQAHMLVGGGAFRFSATAITNTHRPETITRGCLNCHFGTGIGMQFGEHTFRLEDDVTSEQYLGNCNVSGCHAGGSPLTSLDGRLIQDSIRLRTTELATLLIEGGLLTGADADSTEYYRDSTYASDAVKILHNYLFVKSDGSRGSHNAAYANAILRESIERWDSVPRANFGADVITGCAPLSVLFTDSSTGAIQSVVWKFGTASADSSIERDSVRFTFAAVGTFKVSLRVHGTAGDDIHELSVAITDSVPTAAFTFEPNDTVGVGNALTFTNTSTRFATLSWEFGAEGLPPDTTTTTANPVISFASAGNKYARLIAQGATCGIDTAEVVIVVQ